MGMGLKHHNSGEGCDRAAFKRRGNLIRGGLEMPGWEDWEAWEECLGIDPAGAEMLSPSTGRFDELKAPSLSWGSGP